MLCHNDCLVDSVVQGVSMQGISEDNRLFSGVMASEEVGILNIFYIWAQKNALLETMAYKTISLFNGINSFCDGLP